MAKIVYARQNNKLVRKYRCTSGRRKGRIVSSPSQCTAPLDMAKSRSMKRTLRTKGKIMGVKRQITKKMNPISKQVAKMNKLIDGD